MSELKTTKEYRDAWIKTGTPTEGSILAGLVNLSHDCNALAAKVAELEAEVERLSTPNTFGIEDGLSLPNTPPKKVLEDCWEADCAEAMPFALGTEAYRYLGIYELSGTFDSGGSCRDFKMAKRPEPPTPGEPANGES